MDSNIVLFTIGCEKCNVLKHKLDKANVKYIICEDKNKMLELGITRLPVLKVDDKLLEFSEAITWINKNK